MIVTRNPKTVKLATGQIIIGDSNGLGKAISLSGDITGINQSGVATVVSASTSTAGKVQLSNLYNGTSQTKATTEKALNDAYTSIQSDLTTIRGSISSNRTNYVVADQTALNALTGVAVGDLIFITDDGDSHWADYVVTAVDGGGAVTSKVKIADYNGLVNSLGGAPLSTGSDTVTVTNNSVTLTHAPSGGLSSVLNFGFARIVTTSGESYDVALVATGVSTVFDLDPAPQGANGDFDGETAYIQYMY